MKTLILWIDALNKDYIKAERMPFLSQLAKKYGITEVRNPFGYSSIPATLFSGTSTREHGQFTLYWREEHNNFRLSKFLPKKIFKYYFNLMRYLFKKESLFAPPIPRKYFKHFYLAQRKFYTEKNIYKTETLFDCLRQSGKSFVFYNFPLVASEKDNKLTFFAGSKDKHKARKFIQLVKKEKKDLYVLHLWDLDEIGHSFGPNSSKIREGLKEEDELIKEVLKEFDLDKDLVILWTDHFMDEVKGTINLAASLPRFEDGYYYFLDSTMARFWFKKKGKREEILSKLAKIREGRILSKKEKLIFKSQSFGEEIFVVKKGVLICPNFFQEKPIKGMHGYLEERKGLLIINRPVRKKLKAEELKGLILELMLQRNKCPQKSQENAPTMKNKT